MAEDTPDVVPAEEPIVETEAPVTPEEPEQAALAALPEPEDEEPPVRKSVKDFIIERKDRKIAKLQGEDDPEPAQPDIRDVIREELAPITSTFAKSADEQELQAAFTQFPDAKKMEKTIRRYMENDAYARVPVAVIVRSLLYGRTAAKKEADTEAKGTRQGGHTRRPTEAKPKTAWDMSQVEFDKEVSKLMSTSGA